MRNKFLWEAGASAEAAVYGCKIIWLKRTNKKKKEQTKRKKNKQKKNLEVKAEFHMVGEQLLWRSLIPVEIPIL